MILTVTPNPALDLTWHVDDLRVGESHRVAAGEARAGGKGVNVARVLHAEGIDVHALVPTADEAFVADLRASGIPHSSIAADGPLRRSVAVVDAVTGEATLLNESGTALGAGPEDQLFAQTLTLGRSADVVVISGSLPPELDPERLADLVRVLTGAGVRVIVDTSGPGVRAAARAGAVLKPNREELLAATGLTDPTDAARALLAEGAAMIVLSLGEEGLAILTSGDAGDEIRARLPEPLVGNPTGAGDAAVAAVAAELAASPDALLPSGRAARSRLARRATAWSASAVLMPLAGVLHPDHERLADAVILTDPKENS